MSSLLHLANIESGEFANLIHQNVVHVPSDQTIIKDTQQSRIGAMVLGQDLNGVGSYEQTVFAALMNVSSRHVEPGGKVF